MKKITTLLFACLLITKVFAGPSFSISYSNISWGQTFYATGVPYGSVIAVIGNTVSFSVSYSGCIIQPPLTQWFFNGDTIPYATSVNTITITLNQANQFGTYTAIVNPCWVPPINFDVFDATNYTGIPSLKSLNSLNIFPTTVTSSITIQLNSIKSNDIEISFYDMNGKQLKNAFYKNIAGEFIKNENTEALSKGIYFLRIKAGDDVVQKKFVKM